MPVNYCDYCHQPPGCCLCYEEEPLHPDLEHLEEWDDDDEGDCDCLNCERCEACINSSIVHHQDMTTKEGS